MCKALTHDRTPRLSTLSTVVVALLLLLPSLSAALSLRAAGAWRGGEPWANITVSWRDVVEGGDDDWVGAFLQGYNATYVRYVNVGGGSSATFRLLSEQKASPCSSQPHFVIAQTLLEIFFYFRKNKS